MKDEGGGASRSTGAASGTSAATDVSLREHLSGKLDGLEKHLVAEIAALRRETVAANRNSEKAIEVAAHEASERLQAHNGLIEQMRQQAQLFATREAIDDYKDANDLRLGRVERFQNLTTGGLLLIGFVGAANLIKVWAG